MRRRPLILLALAASTLVLSACSTEEGLRAQELLQQAQTAEASLRSATFEADMSASFAGENVRVAFAGGGSPAGQYVTMKTQGIPGQNFDATMVMRGKRAWVSTNGTWQSSPIPAEFRRAGRSASLGSSAFQELARYVTDLRVTENQLVNGKPSSIIAGEVDTTGLLQAATKLGSLSELPGASSEQRKALEGFDFGDLAKLGVEIGEIQAVLTIDETTHLLNSALVRLSIEAEGEKIELRLAYRLTSANRPVALPAAPRS